MEGLLLFGQADSQSGIDSVLKIQKIVPGIRKNVLK